MDREFLAHHIDVFLEHEPLFADATPVYRAMTVHNFVEHLAGNWETIVRGQEQLAAARAAREKEESPREFAITQRFLPPVKLTPTEYEERQQAWREEVAAWKIKFGHTTTESIETIEAKPVKTTAIGYWLSKLGIKREMAKGKDKV